MEALSQSITIFTNSLLFVIYAFALPHHLKTFFWPFKRVAEKSTSPGINLSELGEVISYNLISIVIGMILRTIIILTGLSVLIVVSLLWLALLGPFIIIFSLTKRVRSQPTKSLTVFQEISAKTSLGKFIQKKLALSDDDLKNINSDTDLNTWLQKSLLDEKDLERIKIWYQNLREKGLVDILNRDTVTKISGIGGDWSYGYTNELNKYQVPEATSPYPRVVGRNKEVEAIEEALSKTSQNSVIVAGEPGVGRHAVVDAFARRLFSGNVTPDLVGFRTIYLDLKSALAAGASPLELFKEGRQAGNIILVIDNIDLFFNLADVFNQTLAEGKLRVIGITSSQMVDKQVIQNSGLLKLFTVVSVEPPDLETVFLEMELSIAPVLEKEHRVEISYTAIKEAITSADRFITTIPFPEKAINIIDETVAFVKAEHPQMQRLWGADVQRYLSQKTQIPVGNLSGNQKDKLANLEQKLHERIVGQDEAVNSVSKAMRRAILSVSARNKPVGTFLFLGPTGVGKTETAKALAEIYFDDESRLLRLDMSEFQGEIGLERILDQLPKTLVNNPFAVVLLDEIEKTPPIILNLFLTLLDEGYITDAASRKVSARENIIIGTSNAGALYIKDHGSEGLIDYIQNEKIFSPEFLNRFDGVIVFKPLDDDQLKAVTKKMLAEVSKRIAEKKITLEFPPETVDRIVKEGYDPSFGARSIRRYIQDTIEDEISQKLLSGDYPPGSTLKI